MIIPVKKGSWHRHGASSVQSRTLTAAGHTATEYKAGGIQYWVEHNGVQSPRFNREYQATNWFRDRVEDLLIEGASND